MSKNIFESARTGSLNVKNRIAMAPMARARNADGVPNEDNALYYAQRSGAGLIITEGTAVSATAKGVLYIPGLYLDEPDRGLEIGYAACSGSGQSDLCPALARRKGVAHFQPARRHRPGRAIGYSR